MKKVLLKAYLKNNLGDDIFVKLLLERYKNNFYLYSKYKYTTFSRNKNFILCGSLFSVFLDKVLKRVFNIHDFCETKNKKKYDLMIYIGGSLFIENKVQNLVFWKNNFKQYKKNKIDYYIIGTNFGPFKNKKFIELTDDLVIKSANDVCFRDTFSYNLFDNNNNVRYASDILFLLNNRAKKVSNKKKAVISVINCDKKINSKYTINYERKILDLCKFLNKKGYSLTLMSFCKNEGDEEAINRIIKKIIEFNVSVYFYHDNIDSALKVLEDSDLIAGSRFHANIIGLAMKKVIIPIVYSDKTLNVLSDIKFKGKIFDIRNLDEFNVEDISDDDLTYVCDVSQQKENAKNHFQKLDLVLKRR